MRLACVSRRLTASANNAISYPDEPGSEVTNRTRLASSEFLKSSRNNCPRNRSRCGRATRLLLIHEAGGANRDRTGDLLLAKQALSQLSYGPRTAFRPGAQLVGLGGLEPPTPRLSSVCSNQLSYRPVRLSFLQPISVGARNARAIL